MKDTLNFLKVHRTGILMMLVMMFAVCLGADPSFAMAEVVVTDPAPTNPADNDDKGLATNLDGQAATATHATATGFEQEEYEQAIAQFRPFRFPLEYDIIKNAQQSKVNTYHPIHFRSGSAILETTTTAEVTATGTGLEDQTVVFNASNCSDLKILRECSQIFVKGVAGYDLSGVNETGELCLYVIKVDIGTSVTAMVLNPKKGTATVIPTGTTLIVGAVAGSESQMIVPPDNYQPVPYEVYLQKKLANIVVTDEWMQQAKKVPFVVTDLKNNALYNFKRKNSRTHWLGQKRRITVTIPNIGDEYVYFEEGILRQIPMSYSYAGNEIKISDLNALAKMQFTTNSASNTARAYCGKNAIERILNMDMSVQRDFSVTDFEEAGIKIRRWTNNFGDMDFVHDPTLDDIGYEDFIVVVDIKNAVRYVKREETTQNIDMKKGGGAGDNREASRKIYSCIDCVALKGYNAILFGPEEMMDKVSELNLSVNGTAAEQLPTEGLEDGMVVYLTKDDGEHEKGSLLQYSLSEKKWVDFTGEYNLN